MTTTAGSRQKATKFIQIAVAVLIPVICERRENPGRLPWRTMPRPNPIVSLRVTKASVASERTNPPAKCKCKYRAKPRPIETSNRQQKSDLTHSDRRSRPCSQLASSSTVHDLRSASAYAEGRSDRLRLREVSKHPQTNPKRPQGKP